MVEDYDSVRAVKAVQTARNIVSGILLLNLCNAEILNAVAFELR